MSLVWFSTIIPILYSQTCNYFQNEDWGSGYAQPLDRCIADYTNTVSRLYTCSSDGQSVFAMRFDNSTTCDEMSGDIDERVYSSNNASFECEGGNSCDICIRTWIATSCDIEDDDAVRTGESCYIDGICGQRSTLQLKPSG